MNRTVTESQTKTAKDAASQVAKGTASQAVEALAKVADVDRKATELLDFKVQKARIEAPAPQWSFALGALYDFRSRTPLAQSSGGHRFIGPTWLELAL